MQNNELTLIKMQIRYNKTVVEFILGLHDVLKVPGSIVNPWLLMLPSSFPLG